MTTLQIQKKPVQKEFCSEQYKPLDRCRIFLIGYMGSGKSTIGMHLSNILGWPFIDLDIMIERTFGQAIPDIFKQFGEKAFRQREEVILRFLKDFHRIIVATGGGIVENPANRRWMRHHGVVLWLDASWDELTRRVKGNHRHRPIWSSDCEAFIRYRSRLPMYLQAGWYVNGNETIDKTVHTILQCLRGYTLCCSLF